jgi:hypothetical protein
VSIYVDSFVSAVIESDGTGLLLKAYFTGSFVTDAPRRRFVSIFVCVRILVFFTGFCTVVLTIIAVKTLLSRARS